MRHTIGIDFPGLTMSNFSAATGTTVSTRIRGEQSLCPVEGLLYLIPLAPRLANGARSPGGSLTGCRSIRYQIDPPAHHV